MEAGEAILSDTETYGAHLANITRGDLRMNWMLSRLRGPIRKDAEALTERNAREQRSERAGHPKRSRRPYPPVGRSHLRFGHRRFGPIGRRGGQSASGHSVRR